MRCIINMIFNIHIFLKKLSLILIFHIKRRGVNIIWIHRMSYFMNDFIHLKNNLFYQILSLFQQNQFIDLFKVNLNKQASVYKFLYIRLRFLIRSAFFYIIYHQFLLLLRFSVKKLFASVFCNLSFSYHDESNY